MIKDTQTICRQKLNCFSVFDHSVGLALKGLKSVQFFTKLQKTVDKFIEKLKIHSKINLKIFILVFQALCFKSYSSSQEWGQKTRDMSSTFPNCSLTSQNNGLLGYSYDDHSHGEKG